MSDEGLGEPPKPARGPRALPFPISEFGFTPPERIVLIAIIGMISRRLLPALSRPGDTPRDPRYPFFPFGKKVSQVCPDSGSTRVNPLPAGGFGMRMRC